MNKSCATYEVKIYMAGDIKQAGVLIQQYVDKVGLCVTLEPLDYVYTKGRESGFRVGLIHYPRFIKKEYEEDLFNHALEISNFLRSGLNQTSYSIVTPNVTYWNSLREDI